MKYIYLDNFRGFSETIIPITDVNFLVGENSTGKTSVLGVLDLFASAQFWISQSFDTEEVRFGHFKDIVSIHSDDRSYFTIGVIEDSKNKKTDAYKTEASLFTFKEEFGLPSLSHYTFNRDENVTSIRITPKRILIKDNLTKDNIDAETFIKTGFKAWIKEHKEPSTGYSRLTIPKEFENFESLPLPFLLTLKEQISKAAKIEKDKADFEIRVPRIGFRGNMVWLAPIRTTPKRTYDEVRLDFSPEGTHTPYLVRKILSSKSGARKFKEKLEDIGKQSSLFESVSIQQYGKSATAPFELDIVIDEKALNINTVGYGVSEQKRGQIYFL